MITDEGVHLIHCAAHVGNVKAIKSILEIDPKLVNQKIKLNGITPLMIAVSQGNLEIVRILLEKGNDVNLDDASTGYYDTVFQNDNFISSGMTPLMIAAEQGAYERSYADSRKPSNK